RLSSTDTRATPRSISPRPVASATGTAAGSEDSAIKGLVFGSDQSSMISPFFLPRCSLAGFTFGIVDGAGLAPSGVRGDHDRSCDRRRNDRRGDGVKLAVGALQRRFLDMGRRTRAPVIGGLQALVPCQAGAPGRFLAARIGSIEVERLRLVDPLLPARRRFDQPLWFDLKRGGIQRLEVIGDTADLANCSVKVFQVRDHDLVP